MHPPRATRPLRPRLSAARRYVNKASIKQMAFWTEIVEERPDLGRLHSLTTELNEAVSQAERCFQELFAINSQSLSIIRLYASFNEYVCCNSEKAGVLLHEAERIEDQKTKDHNSEGANRVQIMSESSLEIMTDATAVLTIGGQVRNFGTIVTANNNTMRVFNFSRLHLERRNFFSLLAQPMVSGGGARTLRACALARAKSEPVPRAAHGCKRALCACGFVLANLHSRRPHLCRCATFAGAALRGHAAQLHGVWRGPHRLDVRGVRR